MRQCSYDSWRPLVVISCSMYLILDAPHFQTITKADTVQRSCLYVYTQEKLPESGVASHDMALFRIMRPLGMIRKLTKSLGKNGRQTMHEEMVDYTAVVDGYGALRRLYKNCLKTMVR